MSRKAALDAKGLTQLILMAGLGATYGFALPTLFTENIDLVLGPLSSFLALAGLVAAVLLQLWSWHREGGRQAVVETSLWIHRRQLPPEVPPFVWQPRLQKRESIANREWVNLVAGGLWVALSIGVLFSHPRPTEAICWICGAVIWLGVMTRVLYYNLRWLPVIRALLKSRTTDQDSAVPDNSA